LSPLTSTYRLPPVALLTLLPRRLTSYVVELGTRLSDGTMVGSRLEGFQLNRQLVDSYFASEPVERVLHVEKYDQLVRRARTHHATVTAG
jgi:hypothetical protein